MSQGVFAKMLNVSAKTVQSWEQGERRPSQAALRLLQVIGAQPAIVCEIVGIKHSSECPTDPVSTLARKKTKSGNKP
jgi:predicted transcriptional regulator